MVNNSIPAKPKFKKCRICENRFQIFRSTQKVCSPNCALELARLNAAKKEKKVNAVAKSKLKDGDRGFQVKKAQTLFNKFIRLRDSKQPCISCGTVKPVKYDAGHYKTTKAYPELRFDEKNCHKQCSKNCNTSLSGNIHEYRRGLIERFNIEIVDYLEGPHSPKRYTIPELKALQDLYKIKIKQLEQDQ
jgi:hypothetical protein